MARRKMAKPVNAHSTKKLKRTKHPADCGCKSCKPKTRSLGRLEAGEGDSWSRMPNDILNYSPIPGMEGPFQLRNGRIVYYDREEGSYYDRGQDMYISVDEIMKASNPRKGRGLGRAQKKWRPVESVTGRRRFAAKHGDRCYLVKRYTKTGKVDYKFPVCSPKGNITCQGLEAAYERGRMGTSRKMYPGTANKALRMAKKLRCGWALRHRG